MYVIFFCWTEDRSEPSDRTISCPIAMVYLVCIWSKSSLEVEHGALTYHWASHNFPSHLYWLTYWLTNLKLMDETTVTTIWYPVAKIWAEKKYRQKNSKLSETEAPEPYPHRISFIYVRLFPRSKENFSFLSVFLLACGAFYRVLRKRGIVSIQMKTAKFSFHEIFCADL